MDQDTSQLRAEIAASRREVGDTVAALVEKADVKRQARLRVAETRHAIEQKRHDVVSGGQHALGLDGAANAGEQQRRVAMIVGGSVACLLVLRALRRRNG